MRKHEDNKHINKIIRLVDPAYPDGLIGLYHEDPHENFGDTLARFIAVELEEVTRGEKHYEEALHAAVTAISRARSQLEDILGHLHREWDDTYKRRSRRR